MTRIYSILFTAFMLFMATPNADAFSCKQGGQLCGNSDSACCSGNCIQVPGNNNNYCAAGHSGGTNSCYYDSDCRPGYDCRYGRCEYAGFGGGSNSCYYDSDCRPGYDCRYGRCEYAGFGGGNSCSPSGALCGNSDSACCSGDCIQVAGNNNNYCR
ncbi:MAG: hypothetical protein V4596_14290 [Bdellovibrionota bacterium]